MCALIGAAVALALTEHSELAATALGGALGIALPGVRAAPAAAVVLGIGAAALVSGCTPQHQAVIDTTCNAARRVCEYVDSTCDVVETPASSGGETRD